MTAPVIHLAARQEKVVRACATCRYFKSASLFEIYNDCLALGGGLPSMARMEGRACGPEGRLWEPRPPRRPSALSRAWTWFFGSR